MTPENFRKRADHRMLISTLSSRSTGFARGRAACVDFFRTNPDSPVAGSRSYYSSDEALAHRVNLDAAGQIRRNIRQHLGLPPAKGAHPRLANGKDGEQHRNLTRIEVAISIRAGRSLLAVLSDPATTVDGVGRIVDTRTKHLPAGWRDNGSEPSVVGNLLGYRRQPEPALAALVKAAEREAKGRVESVRAERAAAVDPKLSNFRESAMKACSLLGCVSICVTASGMVSMEWEG